MTMIMDKGINEVIGTIQVSKIKKFAKIKSVINNFIFRHIRLKINKRFRGM